MFPNLYKKKKIIYDDFSKIYLTNIQKMKDNENTDLNNSREHILSTGNNQVLKINNLNTKQTYYNPKDTIKNSFVYSFKEKMNKKQQTLYNKKIKEKLQISPYINTGTLYGINDINLEKNTILINTNYISIN